MIDLSSTIAEAISPEITAASGDAQSLGQELGLSEWLGPLAPIALSPFFGLAALSGIATYGPEWMQQKSALLQSGSSLNSPALFWTMASLALLSSLPRLTKVSKPIALAAEKLEAYSAIIILIVVRMMNTGYADSSSIEQTSGEQIAVVAGLGTFSLSLVLSVFAALNILVINVVKLFCELLVWLIPVPTIDAIVEATNKALCAGLMGLYCFSPWLASIFNLGLLLVCSVIFVRVYRRLTLYRELIVTPVLAWIAPKWFGQRGREFKAFVEESQNTLSKHTCVTVTMDTADCYRVTGTRWFRTFDLKLRPAPSIQHFSNRLLSQAIKLEDEQGRKYVFVFRKWSPGDELYSQAQEALQ